MYLYFLSGGYSLIGKILNCDFSCYGFNPHYPPLYCLIKYRFSFDCLKLDLNQQPKDFQSFTLPLSYSDINIHFLYYLSFFQTSVYLLLPFLRCLTSISSCSTHFFTTTSIKSNRKGIFHIITFNFDCT
jgi:hypothetical protein